ncbi:hypothetical protein [Melittangium boletus]|uniref:hypothetical protein n=1 Tax=Melittangium boletus TaxID=83453 RepID=UPI003DA1EFA6
MSSPRELSSLALRVLHSARHHVRTQSRSPEYFQAADRFSELFLGKAFHLEADYFKTVGTDYSAIDCLYEEWSPHTGREDEASPEAVTERLQEMTRLVPAVAALEELEATLQTDTCARLDVCRALLGTITVLGHLALAGLESDGLEEAWSLAWQERVWRQNSQQARLQRLIHVMRAPAEDKAARMEALGPAREELRVHGTTFVQGVHEYLERYAETGASSVAFVGGLPFARTLSAEGLGEVLTLIHEDTDDFLGRMARLMRFAQDVRFDPSETLNSGVMGYAAETGQALSDVDATRLPQAQLDTWLRQEWERTLAETRQRFAPRVSGLSDASARSSLEGFLTGVYAIATRLADAGHTPPSEAR